MKSIKNFARKLWQDESAQGATEYILLLVVIVAIVVLFKGQIQSAVEAQIGNLNSSISGFGSN